MSQTPISINPNTLVTLGIVDSARLDQARSQAAAEKVDVVQWMLHQRQVTTTDIVRAYAAENHVRFADLSQLGPIDEKLVGMLDFETARQVQAIPISLEGSKVVLAVPDLSPARRRAITNSVNFEFDLAMSDPTAHATLLSNLYSHSRQAQQVASKQQAMTPVSDAPPLEVLIAKDAEGGDSSVPQLVLLLIMEGIAKGASDIHLEPFKDGYRVRYRIDGELRYPDSGSELIDANIADQAIARIKIMSNLDTTQRNRPQDGRIPFTYQGRRFDLRVSIFPVQSTRSTGGDSEKVVARILDNQLAGRPLHELDLSERNLTLLRRSLKRTHGMILVTGPTGSGKSTTLYSAISEVASDKVNILTVEDPVEYKFDGLNQVQVNERVGLTFADALRSFLRADPDVILVGEIRDNVTAEIAIKASLTGHLVLSTLHTNSAALTVSRLLDMDVEPYLAADALTAVVSQRLVKRLCSQCRVQVAVSVEEARAFSGDETINTPVTVYAARDGGCAFCTHGYKGRVALHEVLPVTREVKEAISARRTAAEIEQIALQQGQMVPMVQDGWNKALAGLTDLAQVTIATSEAVDDLAL